MTATVGTGCHGTLVGASPGVVWLRVLTDLRCLTLIRRPSRGEAPGACRSVSDLIGACARGPVPVLSDRSVRAIHNLYEGMAMTTMAQSARRVIGGVDTHKDVHVAAVVDEAGRILGTESFPNDTKGYRQLTAWMARHGELDRVGIEGTGSYGEDLARHFTRSGITVLEVAVTTGSGAG